MQDVWVSAAFDTRLSKPSLGAWLCPEIGIYNVTMRAKALDLSDGLRVGCAMAILDALNYLGDPLVIHLPSYPSPGWVINPKRVVPLPYLMVRLIYKMEVHPRLENQTIIATVSDGDLYEIQLHRLLLQGEVPRLVHNKAAVFR